MSAVPLVPGEGIHGGAGSSLSTVTLLGSTCAEAIADTEEEQTAWEARATRLAVRHGVFIAVMGGEETETHGTQKLQEEDIVLTLRTGRFGFCLQNENHSHQLSHLSQN